MEACSLYVIDAACPGGFPNGNVPWAQQVIAAVILIKCVEYSMHFHRYLYIVHVFNLQYFICSYSLDAKTHFTLKIAVRTLMAPYRNVAYLYCIQRLTGTDGERWMA